MGHRWLALLLACLALALVAGCGGDDEESAGGGAEETTEQTTEESAEEPAEDTGGGGGGAEVAMENIKFAPAEVTVAAGDTVTWTNNDSAPHDVTADGFKSGEPGGMQQGDAYERTFQKAGSFDYVCTVHPGMEGSVTVE